MIIKIRLVKYRSILKLFIKKKDQSDNEATKILKNAN